MTGSQPRRIDFVDLQAQYVRLKPAIDAAIRRVLEHGQFIMGPEVAELEDQLAKFCGAQHAVTVSSGTDALLMSLMASTIGPGDAVFIPSFTFPATAEVAVLAGATPVMVDIEPDTFNLDPTALRRAIARVIAAAELRPRAVIAVDLFGHPASYPELAPIAAEFDVELIADAAQSFGGQLGGAHVGELARITATSFFPAKPLGAYGDGGALFTNESEIAERLRSIRAHGAGAEKYDIQRVGLNARLDTLQAAVLIPKLAVLAEEREARARVARRYSRRLGEAVRVPVERSGARSAWAQYTIVLDDRAPVVQALKAASIPFGIYYPVPLHLQPAYAQYGQGPGSLPVSEELSQRVLSLPAHPYLSDGDVDWISQIVLRGLNGA